VLFVSGPVLFTPASLAVGTPTPPSAGAKIPRAEFKITSGAKSKQALRALNFSLAGNLFIFDANKNVPEMKKFLFILFAVPVVGFGAFFAVRFYYPFGEGVKTGELNYVVYKGVIFKTYEGKLIQSGFRTTTEAGIASNEFVFSIRNAALADSLMRMGGSVVELHYKEYFGALPWRGYSKFIVDDVLSITPARVAPAGEYSPPVVPLTPQL
jgi:hypothetical protein